MADIRINSLPSTATSFNTDDYIAIDGASAGTRRMLAANPPFSDVTLGTSGPSVKSSLSARAPRQGLVFDGTAGATVSVAGPGTSDFTQAAWVRTTGGTQPITSGTPTAIASLYVSSTGKAQFRNDGVAILLTGNATINDGKSHLVVATRTGGTLTIYVDGISDASVADSTNFSTAITRIGLDYSGSVRFTGSLVGPLIYNRALSASEVVALYEAGAPAGADYNSATNTNQITGDAWWNTATGSVSSGTLTMTSGQYILRSAVLTKGKRYRTTYNVTALTGTVQVGNTSALPTVVQNVSLGAGSFEFTANDNGAFGFNAVSGTATITSVTFVPVGLLLAPDAAQAGGGLVWYDTSGNAANITLPASGVSWHVPFGNNIAASGTNQNITLTPSGTGVVRVPKLSSGATDFSAVIGDSFVSSSGSGRAKLLVGTSAADAEIFVGQGSNNSILLKWVYNATTASAYGSLGTYAGNNRLVIQGDGGNVLVGGTIDGGQKLQVSGTAYVSGDATFAGNITRTRSAAGSTGSAVTDYLVRLGNSTSPSAAGVLASNIGASNFRTSLVLRTTDTSGNAVDAATFDYAGDATFAGSRITLGGSGNGEVDIRRATNSNGSSVAYRTTSTLKWYHGLRGLVNDNWYLQNEVAGNTALFFDAATSDATFGGKITTSAPTGGAGAWELGVANTVSPTAPNRTITIEIGGTVYYLHAKTTND